MSLHNIGVFITSILLMQSEFPETLGLILIYNLNSRLKRFSY